MIFVHGIGHFHPDNVIDNKFLESLQIGTTDEWIMERVGIKERRTLLPLDYIRDTYNKNPSEAQKYSQFSNAQTATKAARMALERAKLLPKNIGMVIAGGCLPQYSLPAEACIIAAELGVQAVAFDINSACSTLAAQIYIISQLNEESLPDYILLVVPDNMTRSVDYSDRRVAVLWGDGSSAIIISKKIKSKICISSPIMDTDAIGWNKITIPAGGHFYQEGPVVQKFAIKTTLSIVEQLRLKESIASNQHFFIGHQANLLILESVCNLANINKDKHLYNVDRFGNCGAAGPLSVLSENFEKFSSGHTIIVAMVGAGLSWGGFILHVL